MKKLNIAMGVFVVGYSSLVLQGCSHSAIDRQVDQEVAQETAVKDPNQLNAETNRLIETAPGLSDDQRTKLSALRDTTRTESNELRSQSIKLHSVLLKDLISATNHEEEVDVIKGRIKDLEDKRISLTFNAVKQANIILGHDTSKDQQSLNERQLILEGMFEGHVLRD